METTAKKRRRLDWATSDRPSKITIPERANPFAKLVFELMREQRVTYAELEHRANVLVSTFKAWRTDNNVGFATIEAALGALGWGLVAVPLSLDELPDDVRDKIEEVGQQFRSDSETFGYAVRAAAEWPTYAQARVAMMSGQLRKRSLPLQTIPEELAA